MTGLNGTVAPILAEAVRNAGHEVVGWDRSIVPTDDPTAVADYIHAQQPDWFFHIATGSPDWAEWIAQTCGESGIKFLFTSSVSVFSAEQVGPFVPESKPEPQDEYGRYKLECEQRVRAVNREALVVRLGWQIGTAVGGNHMLDHLIRTNQNEGKIVASTNWYQACSFLADTADSLLHAMSHLPTGLYHLDGNPGLSFYDIVTGLSQIHHAQWTIRPEERPVQNNLLHDSRLRVRSVADWFASVN